MDVDYARPSVSKKQLIRVALATVRDTAAALVDTDEALAAVTVERDDANAKLAAAEQQMAELKTAS